MLEPFVKISLLAFLLTASCTSQYSDEAVEKQIIGLTKQYNKAWETLNVEKIATYHSNHSFLYLGHGEFVCTSNDQFKKVFSGILSMMRKWTVKETRNFSVQVLDQHAVVISFILMAESTGHDGTISDHGSGALTYVWNRINGEWKLIHIHESGK